VPNETFRPLPQNSNQPPPPVNVALLQPDPAYNAAFWEYKQAALSASTPAQVAGRERDPAAYRQCQPPITNVALLRPDPVYPSAISMAQAGTDAWQTAAAVASRDRDPAWYRQPQPVNVALLYPAPTPPAILAQSSTVTAGQLAGRDRDPAAYHQPPITNIALLVPAPADPYPFGYRPPQPAAVTAPAQDRSYTPTQQIQGANVALLQPNPADPYPFGYRSPRQASAVWSPAQDRAYASQQRVPDPVQLLYPDPAPPPILQQSQTIVAAQIGARERDPYRPIPRNDWAALTYIPPAPTPYPLGYSPRQQAATTASAQDRIYAPQQRTADNIALLYPIPPEPYPLAYPPRQQPAVTAPSQDRVYAPTQQQPPVNVALLYPDPVPPRILSQSQTITAAQVGSRERDPYRAVPRNDLVVLLWVAPVTDPYPIGYSPKQPLIVTIENPFRPPQPPNVALLYPIPRDPYPLGYTPRQPVATLAPPQDRVYVPQQAPQWEFLVYPVRPLIDVRFTLGPASGAWLLGVLSGAWATKPSVSAWQLGVLSSTDWIVKPSSIDWILGRLEPMQISQTSLQYVRVPVTASVLGAAYNPTSDTVQMAFLADGAVPQSGDWKVASWETDVVTGQYRAKCLVGPSGTVTLTAGTYRIFVKISDSPEIPVLEADLLSVF
jgi:hypothetical protein